MPDMRVVAYYHATQDGHVLSEQETWVREALAQPQMQTWELLTGYTDTTTAATDDRRPELDRLLVDARTNTFDVLIVHGLNRFTHDKNEQMALVSQLVRAGVSVYADTTAVYGPLYPDADAGNRALKAWETARNTAA